MEDAPGRERARLRWRCRRGRREWDLLLLGWLERHYDAATPAQRARFAAILELPDPELEGYLMAAGHPLGVELPAPPEPGTIPLTSGPKVG